MRQEECLYERNPGTLSLKIQEMVEAGWSVDPMRPMDQFGFMWECWFVRDVTEEELEAQRREEAENASKLSRAEILARARAAKKARAIEKEVETNE